MRIKYYYEFANGFSIKISRELTFNLLKMMIDAHGALVKCKKVAIIECNGNVDEVEVVKV